MHVKFIIDEDFLNYKKASMFIGTPCCTFKCEKECGIKCCQNSDLVKAQTIEIPTSKIVDRYLSNSITSAIVIGGMEPFDSFGEVIYLVDSLRQKTDDDIVIYTGYYKSECEDKINLLKQYSNIIVKFGRFIPNAPHHHDEILGIKLASHNQYAEKIS